MCFSRDLLWMSFGCSKSWCQTISLIYLVVNSSFYFLVPLRWLAEHDLLLLLKSFYCGLYVIDGSALSVVSKTLNKGWYWIPIPWNKTVYFFSSFCYEAKILWMTLSKNINFPASFLLILTSNFSSISHCKKIYSESDILEAEIDNLS